jgi:hypothetical protein
MPALKPAASFISTSKANGDDAAYEQEAILIGYGRTKQPSGPGRQSRWTDVDISEFQPDTEPSARHIGDFSNFGRSMAPWGEGQ